MLHSVKGLYGFTVHASDGDVGQVRDIYFDDEAWAIRYLVVNTGPWLLARQILLSPLCVDLARWKMQELVVGPSREQIENSPDADLNKPVSRQMEEELHHYYGWAPYWSTGARILDAAVLEAGEAPSGMSNSDPHLRSTREVTGYHIQGTDGEIGHVDDFLVEASCWTIPYVLVDTRDFLPGRKVLVSQQWLRGVDWPASKAYVELTREEIEQSPEFDPDTSLSCSYEEKLHDHYGLMGYWYQSML
jgi:hypothetical protein